MDHHERVQTRGHRHRPFIGDFADRFPWAVPAPMGYVEPGWAGIVDDLLESIDALLSTEAGTGTTVDILDVSARRGVLRFDVAVGGPRTPDPAVAAAIHDFVNLAEVRSRLTCPHSGRPRPTPQPMRPTTTMRGSLPHAWAIGR